MATNADFLTAGTSPAAPRARNAESAFFARYATGFALFILLAFAQFEARGLAPFGAFGWEIHAHAAAMVAWLALSVAQPWLAASGNREAHRRIGWAAAGLVLAIPVLGSFAGFAALRDGIVPPFFSPAYLLALVHVGAVLFTAMVVWAVAMHRRLDWHRRLMLGSTALLLEPALGRLLPMPLMGWWGEWVAMACQIAALGWLMAHDRRSLGRIHPATFAAVGVIALDHVLFEALGRFPPLVAYAASIAAA